MPNVFILLLFNRYECGCVMCILDFFDKTENLLRKKNNKHET